MLGVYDSKVLKYLCRVFEVGGTYPLSSLCEKFSERAEAITNKRIVVGDYEIKLSFDRNDAGLHLTDWDNIAVSIVSIERI